MFTQAQVEKPVTETVKPFDAIRSIPGCDAEFKTFQNKGSQPWLDIYTSVVQPINQAGAVVGLTLMDMSRIVLQDTMRSKVGGDKIKKYIIEAPAPLIWQNGRFIS